MGWPIIDPPDKCPPHNCFYSVGSYHVSDCMKYYYAFLPNAYNGKYIEKKSFRLPKFA